MCVGGVRMYMMIEEGVDMLASRGPSAKMTEAKGMDHLCGCGHWEQGQEKAGEEGGKSRRVGSHR